MSVPRLVVTCGDVQGIGLRCFAQAILDGPLHATIRMFIAPTVLRACMDAYRLPGTFEDLQWIIGDHRITIEPLDHHVDLSPGVSSDAASRHAISSLERALEDVCQGRADAVVTLPINKHALQCVGWPYPGQTEMVAAYADGDPLMVLCTREFHVALATIHIPLRIVASSIDQNRIHQRILQLHNHLHSRIGITNPRIAVLGLNPHAGEQGTIGTEDRDIIRPVVESLRTQGIAVDGPLASDGFFGFGAYTSYDGVLAMYHDQGLIPLKLLAKGAGVNVTAGLSIIRTSPDHGTAYDRVLSVSIDAASTRMALEMAATMSQRRQVS